MVYFCLWLTIIVLIGVIAMFFVTRRVGGGSAKYFIRQQKALGRVEGFIEEMMNGQKSNKSILSRRGSQERF